MGDIHDTNACYIRHKYGSYMNVMSYIIWHIYMTHIRDLMYMWPTYLSRTRRMMLHLCMLRCYIQVCDQSSARHVTRARASCHIHTCARTSRHIHTCAWTHISNAASHTRGSHFTYMSKSCHMCMCIWSQICDTYKEV